VKALVVVQARMGSTRLPGKVMLPLAGRPLLERMLQRLMTARFPFGVCIATSTATEDEPIRQLGHRLGVPVVSGDPTDLLARHLLAGRTFGVDVVAKIPSDCPLIDPDVVDAVFTRFAEGPGAYDLVTNLHPPTWPDGNDVEIVPMQVLEHVGEAATRKLEREHTTPFIWEHPDRFRIENVTWGEGRDLSKSHRFTVDYAEDYQLVARIYEELCSERRPVFRLQEILALLEAKPELMRLNARFSGQSWHLAELPHLKSVRLAAHGLEWRPRE
jgi:spore coat polysaccharide biosynthesis protein SpsF